MKIKFRCPPGLKDILPPPTRATRMLPDWLRDLSIEHDIGVFGVDKTVKQCPPFIDAMTSGFIIPLPCDIRVENGRFSWDWPYPEAPVAFHFASQVENTPFHAGNVSVLKFINFWAMETEPGVSVLFTHPMNRPDLPFHTLSGMVDTDGFTELPVHFPAQWKEPDFDGILKQGTPIVQCIPVRRETAEFDLGEFSETEMVNARRLKAKLGAEDHVYRDNFTRRADTD